MATSEWVKCHNVVWNLDLLNSRCKQLRNQSRKKIHPIERSMHKKACTCGEQFKCHWRNKVFILVL
jgi:hypothetical protein